MSDGFDKLKAVGAQKIHEATHIARHYVESMLHEDFEDMNKIQVIGFISILEREYHVDLQELKESALRYFDEHKAVEEDEDDIKVFAPTKKNKALSPLNILILATVLLLFLFITNSYKDESTQIIKVDNSKIESVTNNIIKQSELTIDNNETNSTEAVETQEKTVVNSLKIFPKVEVWLGYIDLEDHKRYQNTFTDEFELDPNKNWLLAFGHGHLKFEVNGEVIDLTIKKNVRFSYINSEFKQIDLEEFKSLNKGDRW